MVTCRPKSLETETGTEYSINADTPPRLMFACVSSSRLDNEVATVIFIGNKGNRGGALMAGARYLALERSIGRRLAPVSRRQRLRASTIRLS